MSRKGQSRNREGQVGGCPDWQDWGKQKKEARQAASVSCLSRDETENAAKDREIQVLRERLAKYENLNNINNNDGEARDVNIT